jgi:hypothetical protein
MKAALEANGLLRGMPADGERVLFLTSGNPDVVLPQCWRLLKSGGE